MTRKILYSTALATCLVFLPAIPAHAEEQNSFLSNASGNVGMYSEYIFRGITQSDESPAMQGTFNLGAATGLYVGVWGSNVDFNDGDEAQLEVDVYGGYKWLVGPATLDTGVIYYAYPGADRSLGYDYIEGKLGISAPVGPATVGFNLFVSPDYFAESGLGIYKNLYVSIPVKDTGLTFNAAIDHQSIDDAAAFGVPTYADWNAGVSYAWEKFTFGVTYYDTNLSKGDCADGCEARVVGSITRSF